MRQSQFRTRNCRPGTDKLAFHPRNQYLSGDVADYLKVTDRTIYRLNAAGKTPAFKVGGSWRFSRADIDAWIKQQSSPADAGEEV